DSAGNGTGSPAKYSQDKDVSNRTSDTSGVRTLVFSARVTTALSGGSITITHPSLTAVSGAGAARTARALVVPDLALSPWLDQTASNTGTGGKTTALSAGTSPATTQLDELVIAAFGYEADMSTFVAGSSYTSLDEAASGNGGNDKTVHVTIGAEYKTVSPTGTQSATASINQNYVYAAAIVAYKSNSSSVSSLNRASSNPTRASSANLPVTVSEDAVRPGA